MFWALYSSGSSGSAPSLLSPIESERFASKASEMLLEEYEAEDDVFVFCRIHIVAEGVSGGPEFCLQPPPLQIKSSALQNQP